MFSAGRFVMARKTSPVVVLQSLYSNCVTALLNGNGANTQTNKVFLDSSANALTVTPAGTPSQGSFSPFGSNWGVYLDGSSRLTTASNNGLNLGNIFTVEMWLKPTTVLTGTNILDNNTSGMFMFGYSGTSMTPAIGRNTVAWDATSSIPLVLNNWNHIVVVRSGTGAGQTSMFINGIRSINTTWTANLASNGTISIGADGTGGTSFTGLISELRVVNGVAVYDPSLLTLTVPTTKLTAIAGTSLLTCQSNQFVDNSTNNFALTAVGTPKVVKSSPFQTNTYDPAVDSGSIVFSGTEYLTVPWNPKFSIPVSGQFCFECFIYLKDNTTFNVLACLNWSWGGAGPTWGFNVQGTSACWAFGATGESTYWMIGTTTVPGVVGQWNHVVFLRDSSNACRIYMNGKLSGYRVDSQGMATGSGSVVVGVSSNLASPKMNAIISNMRFVSDGIPAGYATSVITLGTQVFQPPTSPLTAIANTQLLLLGTNAGITDNSKCQDWTSVGNAQITTGNKKYGTGSIKLDAGGYLQTPITSPPQINMTVGASWTIEMWVMRTGTPSNWPMGIGDQSPTAGTCNWSFGITPTNVVGFYAYNGAANNYFGTTVLALNQWYHIAAVANAGTVSIFVNGIKEGTSAALVTVTPGTSLVIGQTYNVTCPLLIDDLCITNGVAKYSANFTPAVNPNLSADTLGMYNVLQLNAEGTNNGTNGTFLDSSANNLAITKTGTPTQGSFSPYQPNWSTFFNGTTDKVSGTTASSIVGTGNWTAECWIYHTLRTSPLQIICSGSGGSGSTGWLWVIGSDGSLGCSSYGTGLSTTATSVVPLNTWCHIAISCASNAVKYFINGVQSGSATNVLSYTDTGFMVGAGSGTAYYFNGYISNLRVIKGTALYTTAFTPPAGPLTAIAGTSVLVCQSNRFKDNSSNALALTITGTPQVVPQSPFPKVDYVPATHGGSIYYDGTTDYLGTPSSNNLFIGTGDFTIDTNVYLTSLSATRSIISFNNHEVFYINTSGQLCFGIYLTGDYTIGATGLFKVSCWYHLAVVRIGTTITAYLNGVSIGTITNSVSIGSASGSNYLGWHQSGNFFSGYISDLRVVKGIALYTTNFTVPTTPLTAVTNTQLLLNGTNGSVIDQSMSTNLITLGSAVVSTSQFKYGASSMYFPGTAGSYIQIQDRPELRIGLADFTLEAWIYRTASGTNCMILDKWLSNVGIQFYVVAASNVLSFQYNLSNLNTVTTIPATTWTHVRATRAAGYLRLYINGVESASVANATDFSNTTNMRIGGDWNNTVAYINNGYIDDFRLTIGKSRPVFAVPTEQLT
jgi:hypothetical protein